MKRGDEKPDLAGWLAMVEKLRYAPQWAAERTTSPSGGDEDSMTVDMRQSLSACARRATDFLRGR